AAKLAGLRASVKAGGPLPSNPQCKPYGMPLSMSHQGALIEFLFAPGHVIVNSESFETRDIFIDREAPDHDFDRFNGTALGRWEGDTLVIKTNSIKPSVEIFPGIENGGELQVSERIRLTAPDKLEDKITLTSDAVFTAPYSYTVTYTRHREWDIGEYVCVAGEA